MCTFHMTGAMPELETSSGPCNGDSLSADFSANVSLLNQPLSAKNTTAPNNNNTSSSSGNKQTTKGQQIMHQQEFVTDAPSQLIAAAIAEARRVITEEARSLDKQAEIVGESFARAASALLAIPGRIILTGLGKSGHIARKIASTMASTGSPAFFVHPGDLNHGDLGCINRGDAVIILSRSGDVPELMHAILRCHRLEILIIAITARARSKLAEAANVTLLIPDIPEACPVGLAPTTSAVCTLAMGDALAMYMMKRRNFGASDFRVNHPGGNIGRRAITVRELMANEPQQASTSTSPSSTMKNKVPTLMPSCKLNDALPVLLCSRAGMVGVVNECGKLMDVLTDRDIGAAMLLVNNKNKNVQSTLITVNDVLEELRERRLSQSITISDFCTQENDLAANAVVKMAALDLRGVFIVDDGGYAVGFLSLSECLEAGISPSAVCK